MGLLNHSLSNSWCTTNNLSWHEGGRIIVGWKPDLFQVNILAYSSQLIHLHARPLLRDSFFCTSVYGSNDRNIRAELFLELKEEAKKVAIPWVVLGDFNSLANLNERKGHVVRTQKVFPLRSCMQSCNVYDMKFSGRFYTWTNKERDERRVLSKIDRVLCNEEWETSYPGVEAVFLPKGIFDHSPMIVQFFKQHQGGSQFKFCNYWASKENFLDVVKSVWDDVVAGHKSYQIQTKLYRLRKALQENFHKVPIQVRLEEADQKLLEVQNLLHEHPHDPLLATYEVQAVTILKQAKEDYASYIQQRSRLQWLKFGDENTKVFHQSLRHRRAHNTINILHVNGHLVSDPHEIQQAFISFYSDLLCCAMRDRRKINMNIIQAGPVLSDDMRSTLNLTFSKEDIRKAFWCIPDEKAPGLDGYNSRFYKSAWPVIGDEVTLALQEFFANGKMLKAWNTTAVTLIPKITCPTGPGDFRPIACCHTIYKCISKLICSKLGPMLKHVISETQGVFVAGRSIIHNILFCQDIIRHYSRKNCSPSCLIKVDLRKAYDTMD